MQIIKGDGTPAPYDAVRVKKSILRTGASEQVADKVLQDLKSVLKDGMTTRELYHHVFELLKRDNICYACRFSLREAILKLGPAGYKFEQYVASILRAHHYDAHVPDQDLAGACVNHEVDVVAEKDGRRMFIEAKFRNDYRDNVDLKDTMATWSRFLDLVDGAAVGKGPHFDEAWIVTNARFSDRARQFGICKGIHLIGWNFPKERSFQSLVDLTALYPVTVIDDLKQSELEALSRIDVMLCKELVELEAQELAERIDVSLDRAAELIEKCHLVIDPNYT